MPAVSMVMCLPCRLHARRQRDQLGKQHRLPAGDDYVRPGELLDTGNDFGHRKFFAFGRPGSITGIAVVAAEIAPLVRTKMLSVPVSRPSPCSEQKISAIRMREGSGFGGQGSGGGGSSSFILHPSSFILDRATDLPALLRRSLCGRNWQASQQPVTRDRSGLGS